ncbi:DUF1289 domain-containing protein [Amphritea sp.]|uniref:DUF1289 domain-containing protein n=1 Tax=Amphritea sp. TaxID=1872502 RepID=UPI003A8DC229
MKTEQPLPAIAGKSMTPCVRNCCLDEQDICLGCFRSLNEILTWRAASEAEKQATLERCRHRQQQRISKTAEPASKLKG